MRRAGNLLGTTRRDQFGSFAAPDGRKAKISGGVIRSLPGHRGQIPSLRSVFSVGNSWGLFARSVEMMTHRPTMGSLRSSVMRPPTVVGRNGEGEGPGRNPLPDLFLLGHGLAVDAHRGHRPRDQPLLLDLASATLADPELAVVDPF